MDETMLTYIKKEQQTDEQVLCNQDKNLKPFYDWLKQNKKTRWVILATGSSANAIEAARYYVEKTAHVHVDIRIPFLFSNYEQQTYEDEVYIAVSQSGHSYSTIQALDVIQAQDCFVLTADRSSPIAKLAVPLLDIGCGFEAVDLVTMGFSATVVSFMLMGLQAARIWGEIDEKTYQQELQDLQKSILRIDDTLDRCIDWYDRNQKELANPQAVDVIGYGAGYGVSREAETKITETIHCPMNGYELEEYMHGPYLALHKDLTVFFIMSEHPALKARMQALYNYLHKVTPHCFVLCEGEIDSARDLSIGAPVDEYKSALLYVIAFQYLSYRVCADRGVDPMITPYDDFDSVLASKI